jgi:hypothetical protein
MMRFSKTGSVSEQELTRYLLGNLQREDCERLDELSIADDEFIERLSAAENDLVDAYVRDQLRSDALRDFESHYLATDLRRQKVAMARALLLGGAGQNSSTELGFSGLRQDPSATVNRRSTMWFPRLRLGWAFMAAVVFLSATTAWLAVENHRLREQDRASLAAKSMLEEHLRQLRGQLQSEQAFQNSPAPDAEESGARDIGQPARMIGSILLLPPTRGTGAIPVAAVNQTDRWLRLQLALESNDFSEYQVDLMDLTANRRVWRSGPVNSVDVHHRQALSLLLPLADLKDQRYAAEVSGIAAAGGRPEALGSYVFRIAKAAPRHDERR